VNGRTPAPPGVWLHDDFDTRPQAGAAQSNPLFEQLQALREHGSILHAARAVGVPALDGANGCFQRGYGATGVWAPMPIIDRTTLPCRAGRLCVRPCTSKPMHTFFLPGLALAASLLSGCASHSHYAGMESRDIKALSASDIEGLRSGRGMSLALAAELNGYPGPAHVLELADRLDLTAQQKEQTELLHQRMKADAMAAGEAFIEAERSLDRLFAGRHATPEQVSAALAKVAEAQARLRGAHLQAHLEQVRLLSPEQTRRYNALRGYGG
jgi:Spy/CpxP family protein refolding chaperone